MVEQEKRISNLNFWLEVAQAMNVGKSTIDLWAKQRKSERNGVSPTATSLTEDKLKIRELEIVFWIKKAIKGSHISFRPRNALYQQEIPSNNMTISDEAEYESPRKLLG